MMAKLLSKTKNLTILPDLQIASGLWNRMKGLLGTSSLGPDQGLWIHRCNSIHTFFMKYPIDCVFISKDLRVVSVVPEVRPGRVVFPQWGADSVIEMRAGEANRRHISVGEELYVGH